MKNKEKDRFKVFSKVLTMLKDLCDSCELFIYFIPPFELSFDVDRDILRKRLKESDLSEKMFSTESDHVSSLLLATLREDAEDDFIESRIKELKLEDEKAEQERKILREELENVRKTLWNQHLKDRYDLKVSSKAPSFMSIDWDIKLKTKDAKLQRIRFPYATCKIAFQCEFEASPLAFFGTKFFDSVQINFTIDEIEYLMRVFATIRRHLEESEREAKK